MKGVQITILDNLVNSSPIAIERIELLSGQNVQFISGDTRDEALLSDIFQNNRFDGVLHFAGLKAVGESVDKPLDYYENNVGGTMSLLRAMGNAGLKIIIFSSSATVYGDPEKLPVTENSPRKCINPYGQTKLMCEHILEDIFKADPSWRIAMLRYFNPVGAHKSGQIGEDPNGTPNNLMPLIGQVAAGKREILSIYGDDYPTTDGTGVRDYIHVEDLVLGHLAALDHLNHQSDGKLLPVNLGTGHGTSVMEIVKAFQKASGKTIATQVLDRRAGDIACSYADTRLAKETLDWEARRSIDEMCEDTWRWLRNNADGYQ